MEAVRGVNCGGSLATLLERGLVRSLKDREAGVNILVYGQPGTGKTELARMLAARVGAQLYEVRVDDNDGEPATEHERHLLERLE